MILATPLSLPAAALGRRVCAGVTLLLASLATAQTAPLVPAGRIAIPDSAGKFDFLAVDPGRHRLLAAHEKDGTADFLDLDKRTVLARVKTGPTVGIATDPKTGNYFASVQDDKRVAVIDAGTLKEIASVPTDAETDAILFDPDDRLVFVTNDNGRYLWAIDPDALKVVAAIAIPGAPECMAYDAGAGRIYLNIKATDQVAAIDIKTRTVVALWPVAPATKPHGLVFDPATSWILSSGDNAILVAIDARTGKVVSSAPIAPKVDQIALDLGNHRVYCAGTNLISVTQEAAGGLKPLGQVTSASTAKNVAVDPASHDVWTTYTDGTNSYAQAWSTP